MNIRLIFFVTTISTVSMLSATCYRGSDGYFRCKEKGKKEYRLSDIKDYKTKQENYRTPPYGSTFDSDPTSWIVDGTNRPNGNR